MTNVTPTGTLVTVGVEQRLAVHIQLTVRTNPLPTVGSDCELDVDCKSLLNSHCHQGSCRCDVGHRPDGNTCRNYTVACVSSPSYTWDADTDMCNRIETQVTKSWADAERACTMSQGHLIRPDTATKNDKLRELVKQLSPGRFWIGARYNHVTKKWQWFDNTTITSAPWAPGEHSGDGSCVDHLRLLQYQWNDDGCQRKAYYACEIPLN
ncbi:snaclec VP12 subunit B-like [Haliotis cracherodii]|uniref:snaclec VP12 subunit B-like n=1 Tax=Haliotis cracherodii TaxID=6455 RepID=UPI0039EAE260